MSCLVCLLEEPSAREMLKGVFARLLPPEFYVRYVVFEGKQDLEKQLERRLRLWQAPNSLFLVMRGQDAGDCVVIKQRLLNKVRAAGKVQSPWFEWPAMNWRVFILATCRRLNRTCSYRI